MAKNAKIGSLHVELGLNSAQFEEGLKKARAGLSSFGKAAGLLGGLAGAAAVAGVTALAAGMKQAIDRAEELGAKAQTVGESVEEFSRLGHAAQMSNVEIGSLTTGLKKLSVNLMAAAGDADGKAAQAFRALGVSVTDANGDLRTGSDVMKDVATRFAGMEDGAGKTALAVALFGKSGSDLIPMLNEGRAGIEALESEADRLGLTIDEKTAKSADAFNDNLQLLGLAMDGVVTKVTAGALPGLEALSGAMVDGATNTEFMDMVSKTLSGTLKLLASAAVITGEAFVATYKTAVAVVQAAKQIMAGDFSGAFRTMNQKAFDTAAVMERLNKVWAATGEGARATAGRVRESAPILEKAAKDKKKALTDEEKAYKKAKAAADDYIDSLQDEIDTWGLSREQVADKEALREASEALAAGLAFEAATILRLVEARRKLREETAKVDPWSPDLVSTPEAWNEAAKGIDTVAESAEAAAQQAWDIRTAVDDVFYGIKNNDWLGAFGGLMRAIEQVKVAFSAAGDQASRMSAIAGVGGAIGGMIGGKVGGALSGAASGFAMGNMIMPGIGGVVGGIIGGIGGLFGASKAKKRRKKAEAEQRRQEAERKAQEKANALRELEIRLMELEGKTREAELARRADTLKAMDAEVAEQQKAVWAAEDLAAAEAKLTEARAQHRQLEVELAEASGDAAGALRMLREDELAALPESLRPLQQAVWNVLDANEALAKAQEEQAALVEAAADKVDDARDVLADAYEREASAIEDLRDRFADLADTLADLGRELAGEIRTAANPQAQARAARADFERISALAASGDAQAMADLPNAVRAFLDAEAAVAPNAMALNRARQEAKAAVARAEAAARAQVSNAEASLAELKASVAQLLQLNESVVSVRDAISELGNRLHEAAMAEAHAQQALADQVAAAAAAAAAAAQAAAASRPAATVGQDQQSAAQALAAELAPYLAQITVNTGQTARSLDDATQGGDALRTVAA